jgi:predicted nicotinamide N-methyase
MTPFSLDLFFKVYDTENNDMVIGGRKFNFLTPRILEDFIDKEALLKDFPLWAKIWEASWVLADYLAACPIDPDKSYLEIGGGLGLVSVVAASFGHRITMTEHNPHALQFALANAHINQCSSVSIEQMDWHTPQINQTYDVIVGSEVVYHERDFAPLQKIFADYLKPGGEIVLTAAMRQITGDFLKQMQDIYNVSATQKVLRTEGEEIRIALCRLTRTQ